MLLSAKREGSVLNAKYLLFTNVDPGTQTLTPAGGTTIGGGDIPVVAGQVTWVTTLMP